MFCYSYVYQQDDDQSSFPNLGGTHIINQEHIITLEKGESLGLEVMIRCDLNYPGPFYTYDRDLNYKLLSGVVMVGSIEDVDLFSLQGEIITYC